jgi:hypothetical protein
LKSAARVFCASSYDPDSDEDSTTVEKFNHRIKSKILASYIRYSISRLWRKIFGKTNMTDSSLINKKHLTKHIIIMTGTTAGLYAIMFGLLGATGQRLC